MCNKICNDLIYLRTNCKEEGFALRRRKKNTNDILRADNSAINFQTHS